jgi:putative flippase GtrA
MRQRGVWSGLLVFATMGTAGTLIQYLTLGWIVSQFGESLATMGSSLGFILGAGVNYQLNYRITFQSNSPHVRSGSRYGLVLCVGWFLNALILSILLRTGLISLWVAQLIATCCGLVWNYAGSRIWAFAPGHSRVESEAVGEVRGSLKVPVSPEQLR